MKEAVGIIQTSWPKIRIVLYRMADGQFQFLEESSESDSAEQTTIFHKSGLYADIEAAKADMIEYAVISEDDRVIDSQSVVILDPAGLKL